ncbi:DUF1127 domain-containing protein [Cereibacter sphaeroides]|uniref:DUF1127 domain-containing protein n=1 Tax=Cereibacter sphaeroides TaxID=1063 RepID=UPI001F349FD9|nr:DUF1127 domain-containing protein [Cereibacter sphaeroides]MCE6958047.1 DUF1127 domain-containing protein [Cereibacter sphaeroides]MCE6971360.1 DUF1127 domain-containing protein [Cereibacter sphaeroides]
MFTTTAAATPAAPNLFRRLLAPLVQYQAFRATLETLRHLDLRQLADIGLCPGDIGGMAWKAGERARDEWLGLPVSA